MDAAPAEIAREIAATRAAMERKIALLLARLHGAERPEQLQRRWSGMVVDRGGPAGRIDS